MEMLYCNYLNMITKSLDYSQFPPFKINNKEILAQQNLYSYTLSTIPKESLINLPLHLYEKYSL